MNIKLLKYLYNPSVKYELCIDFCKIYWDKYFLNIIVKDINLQKILF